MESTCLNVIHSKEAVLYEEYRLSTFNEWDIDTSLSKRLAANGFYFLGFKDHCVCAFCHGVLGDFKPTDDIEADHKKHYPQCRFIGSKVHLPVGNVTLSHSASLNRLFEIIMKKSEKDRMWISSLQKKKNLQRSTSFQCYSNNSISCVNCEEKVYNIRRGFDIWEDHAERHPQCQLKLDEKRKEFVNSVYKEKEKEKADSAEKIGLEVEIDASEIDIILGHLMGGGITIAALNMGFKNQIVKDALFKNILQNGHMFRDLEQCLNGILKLMSKSLSRCCDLTHISVKVT